MAGHFIQTGKKIVAIGRNYAAHAAELKNAVPKEPFFFLKPTSSYLTTGGAIEIPKGILAHHEVELGVVIGKTGRDIQAHDWKKYVAGYTLAIDMTARNLQDQVKAKGLPWSAVKGFDTFCPVAGFLPRGAIKDPHECELWLKINGQYKQKGSTNDMIFRIPELLQHCSSIMTLEEGDLLLTGTPSGVGPIKAGDKIEAGLVSEGDLKLTWSGTARDRVGGYHFVP